MKAKLHSLLTEALEVLTAEQPVSPAMPLMQRLPVHDIADYEPLTFNKYTIQAFDGQWYNDMVYKESGQEKWFCNAHNTTFVIQRSDVCRLLENRDKLEFLNYSIQEAI